MGSSPFPHFSESELSCNCGECDRGSEFMNTEFMRKLVAIRRELDFPLPVTSAYRCPDYNDQVSSTGETGPHTTGHAVDIAVSGHKASKLVAAAVRHGMTGIGVNQKGEGRFIHLDDLGNGYPRPTMWSY